MINFPVFNTRHYDFGLHQKKATSFRPIMTKKEVTFTARNNVF